MNSPLRPELPPTWMESLTVCSVLWVGRFPCTCDTEDSGEGTVLESDPAPSRRNEEGGGGRCAICTMGDGSGAPGDVTCWGLQTP